MLPVQSKMARVALGMGVRELAALAGVSPDTIARLERGVPLREGTLQAIQRSLEAAGIEFTNGDQPGVRMRKGTKNRGAAAGFDGSARSGDA